MIKNRQRKAPERIGRGLPVTRPAGADGLVNRERGEPRHRINTAPGRSVPGGAGGARALGALAVMHDA
jgi:hypothetical protein